MRRRWPRRFTRTSRSSTCSRGPTSWPPSSLGRTETRITRQNRALAQRSLEGLRAETPSRAGVRVSVVIVHGSPAEEIVSFSHDKAFDMVVIGTHGRTGFSHVLMGSVAEAVVRRASCAVLTLHIPFPAAGALTIAGTKSEMERRVVSD